MMELLIHNSIHSSYFQISRSLQLKHLHVKLFSHQRQRMYGILPQQPYILLWHEAKDKEFAILNCIYFIIQVLTGAKYHVVYCLKCM
jgi:hypothetical protein